MLYFNDVIKICDYCYINKTSPNSITAIVNQKSKKIKGNKVEKYIVPILPHLYHFNTLEFLYDIIEEKDDLNENDFIRIIERLLEEKIIEKKNKNYLIDNNDNNYTMDKKSFINLTILIFTDCIQIQYLIKELQLMSFKKIKLISFYSEQLKPDKIELKNEKNIEMISVHYSRLFQLMGNLTNDNDLLLSIQSSDNIELNQFLNNKSIKNNSPWLNCIIDDYKVEIGPFVINKYTACLRCTSIFNEEYNNVDYISEIIPFQINKINRSSMIFLGIGMVLDEIKKFLNLGSNFMPPITLDTKVVFRGDPLEIKRKFILKNPRCSLCK